MSLLTRITKLEKKAGIGDDTPTQFFVVSSDAEAAALEAEHGAENCVIIIVRRPSKQETT